MAELINTNVFDATKKFVDFSGLDYFWVKAKAYVDAADKETADTVTALKTTVGDANSGLVKDVKSIQDELNSLSGGAGSIATQIENAIGTLDVEDTAVEGQYVSSVSETDGKITVNRTALPDYTEVYDAKGAAATAETNAKAYADGLVMADGVAKFDAAGTAAGLNTAMDARVAALEAIDHDKIATDAAATAVAGVIDGAPEKFDTLKEIAAWIAEADTAEDAASLVTRVSALEAIDHDAYKAADTALETSLKGYVDGKDSAMNTRVTALETQDVYVKNDVDAAIADAKKAGTDAATALDDYKGEMTTALAGKADKSVVDGLVTTVGNAESGLVKDVADLKAHDVYVKNDVDTQISNAQAAAIAQAKVDAAETLKSYYTKTEVDSLLSTNSQTDQAYAKTYTDELFNSIQFAQNADIDSIFAPETPETGN